MNIGYIWTVREEWGKKTFEKRIVSHYDYAYSIPRFPQKGDIIVFYYNLQLLGSIPVDSSARPTTSEDAKKHPWWGRPDWKYIMGLDGTRKIVFRPPVRVEDVADDIAILKGKRNLHAVCRNAPKITMNEYQLILDKAKKH
jgi:hypothetical protein